MKYATYTKQEDEKVIDENDFELIENWQKSSNIVEVDPPDSMEKKDLCYGAYLFNHGIDKLKSVEYMREMRGHYISTILYDKSSTVSLLDFPVYLILFLVLMFMGLMLTQLEIYFIFLLQR